METENCFIKCTPHFCHELINVFKCMRFHELKLLEQQNCPPNSLLEEELCLGRGETWEGRKERRS